MATRKETFSQTILIMPVKIYSYVLRFDDGAAPNPFWGWCTLTICKPYIRKMAKDGDWIIGTGSKNTCLKDGFVYDLSDTLVYAMKVTRSISLEKYDEHCKKYIPGKIPKWPSKDFRRLVGDSVIDFKNKKQPSRLSVHNLPNMNPLLVAKLRETDLKGKNALLSNHFYYFGEEPRTIPIEMQALIKKGRGHKILRDGNLIKKFEDWISQFDINKIYADPQLKYSFSSKDDCIISCSIRNEIELTESIDYFNDEISK